MIPISGSNEIHRQNRHEEFQGAIGLYGGEKSECCQYNILFTVYYLVVLYSCLVSSCCYVPQ
jgi:hypothetical protein